MRKKREIRYACVSACIKRKPKITVIQDNYSCTCTYSFYILKIQIYIQTMYLSTKFNVLKCTNNNNNNSNKCTYGKELMIHAQCNFWRILIFIYKTLFIHYNTIIHYMYFMISNVSIDSQTDLSINH